MFRVVIFLWFKFYNLSPDLKSYFYSGAHIPFLINLCHKSIFKKCIIIKYSIDKCNNICDLHKSRTNFVFGVGDPNADLMLVGEAPGEQEDLKGEPFVGRAGKLLDDILRAIQKKRGQGVYIANVLKCRPPNNRDPLPSEVEKCEPYLVKQIEKIHDYLESLPEIGKVLSLTSLIRVAEDLNEGKEFDPF